MQKPTMIRIAQYLTACHMPSTIRDHLVSVSSSRSYRLFKSSKSVKQLTDTQVMIDCTGPEDVVVWTRTSFECRRQSIAGVDRIGCANDEATLFEWRDWVSKMGLGYDQEISAFHRILVDRTGLLKMFDRSEAETRSNARARWLQDAARDDVVTVGIWISDRWVSVMLNPADRLDDPVEAAGQVARCAQECVARL
jgi:hypothetical protein